MIIVQEYLSKDQKSPFRDWFSTLPPAAALKIATALTRIESGNTSNIKWFDGLGEFRINWGPGYRIYLIQEGKRLIILFGGGTKSGQTTDIKRARLLIADYKAEKRRQERGV
ncbi:type II toxin-antitoxin system RelE/ParE family toxin [Pseudomonas putida]|jgi:putative addiction module killer protein|uniref:type II toxin-antitoxin system RelE/ParE family toxin n=1 Tax=Pseudomonas TaxID=286 RepID=UPI002363E02E|nr:type II toxin-antitoxin system RelE/ParE family toxin [Pseudomonas putida]MDD1968833.1 type II toxin-antitoxin system RelE/ParE family toxin [Pseudomonas putida]